MDKEARAVSIEKILDGRRMIKVLFYWDDNIFKDFNIKDCKKLNKMMSQHKKEAEYFPNFRISENGVVYSYNINNRSLQSIMDKEMSDILEDSIKNLKEELAFFKRRFEIKRIQRSIEDCIKNKINFFDISKNGCLNFNLFHFSEVSLDQLSDLKEEFQDQYDISISGSGFHFTKR